MKNLKKVLALVVVFAMMLSTVAFAGTFADVADDATYAGAVEVLAALGYFKGDDNGNFNPDATITRAEYATIVCRLLGIADSATGTADFADVAADHWATGYIKMANQYGIVAGYGDGNFGPEDPVKYEEAVKMLVCALGYEPMALSKGGWPTGYVAVASQIGLLDGIAGAAEGTGAARSLVAVMTYNALDIPVMEQMGFGTEISYEIMKENDDHDKSTILTKVGIYKLGGVIEANSKVAYFGQNKTDIGYVTMNVDDDYDVPVKALNIEAVANRTAYTKTFSAGATNAEDLVANRVIVYVEEISSGRYEIKAIELDAASVSTLKIKATDLNPDELYYEASKPYIRYYKEGVTSGDGTKVSLEANYAATWNNEQVADTFLTSNLNDAVAAMVEFIDLDNDNYYDIVKVYEYSHLIAETVDVEKGVIETYQGTKVDLDIENEDANVTIKDINGNTVALEDIADGDVLAMIIGKEGAPRAALNLVKTANYDSLDIVVLKGSSVTGAVTEYDETVENNVMTELTIAVDGTEYDVAFIDKGAHDISKIDLQSEGTFYLGISGDIIGFVGDKVSNNNYGLIMSAYTSSNKSVAPQLTVLTKDGSEVTYDVASSLRIVNPTTGKYTKVDVKDTLTSEDLAYIAGSTWNGVITASGTLRNELYTAFGAELDENTVTDKVAAVQARFVTYKLNANNEIVEITPAVAGNAKEDEVELGFDAAGDGDSATTTDKVAYNANGQKLGKYLLADDAVVFDVDVLNPSSSKVSDVSYFVDDSEYEALLYTKDEDGYYGAAVILVSDAVFEEGAGIAIVESKTSKLNENEDTVTKVVAYKDGAEVELTFDDEEYTEVYSNVSPDEFAVGTVIMYNADANGIVSKYAVVGATTVTSATKTFAFDTDFAGAFTANVADGDAFYLGWISAKTKNDANIDVAITDAVAGATYANTEESFTVTKANQYTITGTARNTTITNGTYTDGNVDAADTDADGNLIGYYVLVRTFEEEVIDIVAFDDKGQVVIAAAAPSTPVYEATFTAGTYADKAAVEAAAATALTVKKDGRAIAASEYTVAVSEPANDKVTVTVTIKADNATTTVEVDLTVVTTEYTATLTGTEYANLDAAKAELTVKKVVTTNGTPVETTLTAADYSATEAVDAGVATITITITDDASATVPTVTYTVVTTPAEGGSVVENAVVIVDEADL